MLRYLSSGQMSVENLHPFLISVLCQEHTSRSQALKGEIRNLNSGGFPHHLFRITNIQCQNLHVIKDMKNGCILQCFSFLTEINVEGSQKSIELTWWHWAGFRGRGRLLTSREMMNSLFSTFCFPLSTIYSECQGNRPVEMLPCNLLMYSILFHVFLLK